MSSFSPKLSPEALRAESAALRALARELLDNEHDAEDVEQDTWVAALQHQPTNTDRATAWLRRVGRNFALRLKRKERARRRWEQAAARPEVLASTEEIVERVELHQQVVEAVLALDEPYRTTALLRFWEDLPPRQAAQRMGVPVATVRTRVRRAVALLRDRLDQSCGGRGAWAVLLSSWVEQLPHATVAAVPSIGLVLVGGILMATKVKIVAVAICAVALSWPSWNYLVGRADSMPLALADEVVVTAPTMHESQHEVMTTEVRREKLSVKRSAEESKKELDQSPVLAADD